jgi:hypothetical protein
MGGPSWSWSYVSWIYNYLCNQCLSPIKLWVWTRSWRGVLDTTLCDEVCQWLATGWWFSLGTSVSSTDKTDRHDITEILLKVALNTINLNQNHDVIMCLMSRRPLMSSIKVSPLILIISLFKIKGKMSKLLLFFCCC